MKITFHAKIRKVSDKQFIVTIPLDYIREFRPPLKPKHVRVDIEWETMKDKMDKVSDKIYERIFAQPRPHKIAKKLKEKRKR